MALSDLQAFIQQRLLTYDSSLDITSGSPLDTQVVQPILNRIGTDPFSVDFIQFAQDRLSQEFPDMATRDGDAITDLLIKPAALLMDPLIRENVRIQNGQSFANPTILTTEEADALGANLFAQRDTGDFALGQARLYFAAPQNVTVSAENFVSSNTGLHYFPTEVQAISPQEMLFNTEGTLYYFDINVIAEQPGDSYNIDAGSLTSIANIASAVKVTNKRRFRYGTSAENAATFIGRAEQELSERSLVSQRGVIAKITSAFTEVTEVAVTGFNDVEMQRDILTGGGLGSIVAAGFKLRPVADGVNGVTTKRVSVDPSEFPLPDFTSIIGPPGAVSNFVLTVYGGATLATTPAVQDIVVASVVDSLTLDLAVSAMNYSISAELPWSLREVELSISGIPGGIIFPNTPQGTISLPSNEVHIGGCVDMFIRATSFDSATLVLNDVVDDQPILFGVDLTIADINGHITLGDYTLSTNYSVGDSTYQALQTAAAQLQSLQIMEGPAAGSYTVLSVVHMAHANPVLLLDPVPVGPIGSPAYRWRLLSTLYIDLSEPKETKISGSDLITTQNISYVETAAGLDFDTYGVGNGDILRVLTGPDVGDYTVQSVLAPFFQRIQLDRPLVSTSAGIKYLIFRKNLAGGVQLPLVRVDSISLLDSSGQPTGSNIPYAKPIDVQSQAFATIGRGIKEDLSDGILGLVGQELLSGANVNGTTLVINYQLVPNTGFSSFTVNLIGTNPLTATQIVSQINSVVGQRIAVVLGNHRVALLPIYYFISVSSSSVGDTATHLVFGSRVAYTTASINSPTIDAISGVPTAWLSMSPGVDPNYDVVQVLDGNQVGYYDNLSIPDTTAGSYLLSSGSAFIPEIGRHVQVGGRSIGLARCYFLDPTSITFNSNSLFSTKLANGTVLKYLLDKVPQYQIIPALPNDAVPKDGTTSTNTLQSLSSDFFRQGVHVEDVLQVTFQPITGTVMLADPVSSLVFTTLIISFNSGVDKVITFVNDSLTIGPTNVTRAGVVTQINNAVGLSICHLTSSNQLEFEYDFSIIIRSTGTANTTLGFSTVSDSSNEAGAAGTYIITNLTATSLTLAEVIPTGQSRQHFLVVRPSIQRCVSTTMSTQTDASGLYYFDVELISQGTGAEYNIPAASQMTVTGYTSDGYWLTTLDPNLTFSTAEKPILNISRSILEVGVSDSPMNATQISGQNLQISYDQSTLTASVQDYVSSEEERVICESPLARHLIPYFIRFGANYVGGSAVKDVLTDVTNFINGLGPNDFFNVSDLEKLISNRGAVSIQNPITLLAVIHNFDRSISVERSEDKINVGRLACFVPDVLNITRQLS